MDAIFYPCMSYNFDEQYGGQPLQLSRGGLLSRAAGGQHARPGGRQIPPSHTWACTGPKTLRRSGAQLLETEFRIPKRRRSVKASPQGLRRLRSICRTAGAEEGRRRYIAYARENGRNILVVAGRPYHMDPEINHGINDLITSFGFVAHHRGRGVPAHGQDSPAQVLNQWTYHARMYNAARYVVHPAGHGSCIQLVSFGCGVDAITTDEMRSILEEGGKLYTQLKIDDITNLGAVKIRIRSLMAALDAAGRPEPERRPMIPWQNWNTTRLAACCLLRRCSKEYTILMPQMLPSTLWLLRQAPGTHGLPRGHSQQRRPVRGGRAA